MKLLWHTKDDGELEDCNTNCNHDEFQTYVDFLEDWFRTGKKTGKCHTRNQHQVPASILGVILNPYSQVKAAKNRKIATYNKDERRYYNSISAKKAAAYPWLYEDRSLRPNTIEKEVLHTEENLFIDAFRYLSQLDFHDPLESDSEALKALGLIPAFASMQSYRYKSTMDMYEKVYQSIINLESRRRNIKIEDTGKMMALKSWRENQISVTKELYAKITNGEFDLRFVHPDSGDSDYIIGDRPVLLLDSERRLLDPFCISVAKFILVPLRYDLYMLIASKELPRRNFTSSFLNKAQFQQAQQWVMAKENQEIKKRNKIAVNSTMGIIVDPSFELKGEQVNIKLKYHPNFELVKNGLIDYNERDAIAYYQEVGGEHYEKLILDLYRN